MSLGFNNTPTHITKTGTRKRFNVFPCVGHLLQGLDIIKNAELKALCDNVLDDPMTILNSDNFFNLYNNITSQDGIF